MLLYYPVLPKVTMVNSPDYPCIFKKKKRFLASWSWKIKLYRCINWCQQTNNIL